MKCRKQKQYHKTRSNETQNYGRDATVRKQDNKIKMQQRLKTNGKMQQWLGKQ